MYSLPLASHGGEGVPFYWHTLSRIYVDLSNYICFVLLMYWEYGTLNSFTENTNNIAFSNSPHFISCMQCIGNVVGNEQNCTKVSNISQIWVALTSMQMCNYEWTFIKRFCAFFASPHFKLVGSCKNRSIAGKTEHMYVDRCSPRILRCGIDISRYFAAFFTWPTGV